MTTFTDKNSIATDLKDIRYVLTLDSNINGVVLNGLLLNGVDAGLTLNPNFTLFIDKDSI